MIVENLRGHAQKLGDRGSFGQETISEVGYSSVSPCPFPTLAQPLQSPLALRHEDIHVCDYVHMVPGSPPFSSPSPGPASASSRNLPGPSLSGSSGPWLSGSCPHPKMPAS